MAPMMSNGKVIAGNSGSQLGVCGWIAAPDVKTRNVIWKAYNIGRDAELLIGNSFHPLYATIGEGRGR
jgi:hypothetical protein